MLQHVKGLQGVIGSSYDLFKLTKLCIIDPNERYHNLRIYHIFLNMHRLFYMSYDGIHRRNR